MGGYYYGHCPCNKNGVCTYTGDGMRCVPKKQEKPPAPEVPPPQVPSPHPTLPPKERPGQKQDSQESEEIAGKPGGRPKPTDDAAENELPELPFESLRGPGVGNNAIPPLISHGSGSPGSRRRPSVTTPDASSPNSVNGPAPSTSAGGSFGQDVNGVPTAATRPHLGGTGTAGQPESPTPAHPSAQLPNLPPASGPSTSAQGAPIPSTFPSSTTGTVGLPGLPPSPPTNGNNGLLPGAEQKPSRYPSAPPPAPSDNELPPIVDENGTPPPLPPSPIELLNNRLRAEE